MGVAVSACVGTGGCRSGNRLGTGPSKRRFYKSLVRWSWICEFLCESAAFLAAWGMADRRDMFKGFQRQVNIDAGVDVRTVSNRFAIDQIDAAPGSTVLLPADDSPGLHSGCT